MSSNSKHRRWKLFILLTLVLVVLAGTGLGTYYVLGKQHSAVATNISVGQAFFVSSGQLKEGYTQGINDELQVGLHNIPDPASGKSYYAWLLSDKGVSPQQSILLGSLSVHQGNVQFLYQGDAQHTNLLGITSRLLITEEEAAIAPKRPSSNQSMWHYYAELPQTPDTQGSHKKIIDILRALLFTPIKLQPNWQGCVDIDFFTNVHKILDLADSSKTARQRSDALTLHTQAVLILDYLDGLSLVGQDVPLGSSIQANNTLAQVPLIDINENQEISSYVDRINYDLTALYNRTDATEKIRQLAQQTDNVLLDNIKQWLEQVRQDARKLVTMTDTQLLLTSTLSIVNDLAIQASNAFNGHLDTSTSQMQEGAAWVHSKDQQLATFDISSYPL